MRACLASPARPCQAQIKQQAGDGKREQGSCPKHRMGSDSMRVPRVSTYSLDICPSSHPCMHAAGRQPRSIAYRHEAQSTCGGGSAVHVHSRQLGSSGGPVHGLGPLLGCWSLAALGGPLPALLPLVLVLAWPRSPSVYHAEMRGLEASGAVDWPGVVELVGSDGVLTHPSLCGYCLSCARGPQCCMGP